MTTTRCRSCDALVSFIRNDRGRLMCLNAFPDRERGNVEITTPGDGATEVARVLGHVVAEAERNRGTLLYVAHQMACPKGAEWRK